MPSTKYSKIIQDLTGTRVSHAHSKHKNMHGIKLCNYTCKVHHKCVAK